MKLGTKCVTLMMSFIVVGLLCAKAGKAQNIEQQIRQTVANVGNYDYGKSRAALMSVEEYINTTHDNVKLRRMIEEGLVAVLNSDAAPAAKQFAGHKLTVIGSDFSVPALAKLLASQDQQMVEIACYALRQKPSPAVKTATRNALGNATGSRLIPLIHLLGDLRDGESINAMVTLASSKDMTVAEAAILELSSMASDGTVKELQILFKTKDEKMRTAVAGGLLNAARNLALQGKESAAITIYQGLYAESARPELPRNIRRGALLGHLQLAGNNALSLVTAALHAHDQDLEAAAISFVPQLEGANVNQELIKEIPRLSSDLQATLIAALSDRGDRSLTPLLVKTAQDKTTERQVRVEALKALAKLGDASHIEMLVNFMGYGENDISRTAELVMSTISAPGTDEAILQQLKADHQTIRSRLINIIADRQCKDAVPLLLEEAKSENPDVSYAAFRALGMLAMPKDLAHFVELMLDQKDPRVRSYAESTVGLLAKRSGTLSGGDDVVYSALESAKNSEDKNSLFRVLKIIGDERAFTTMANATLNKDPLIQENAIRVLAEWPTSLAEERLLEIIKNKVLGYRVLAFRGYIRLLKQSNEPDSQVLDKYSAILAEAKSADEIKLALSGLARIDRFRALELCTKYIDRSDVNMEAGAAAISVAKAIIRDMDHIPEIKLAMQKVIASGGNEALAAQAKAVIDSYEPFSEKLTVSKNAPGDWDERWEGYLTYKPHPTEDRRFFNGQDTKNWQDNLHPEFWHVDKGVIIGHCAKETETNSFLWSPVQVKDFYLSIDVKLEPDSGNAGIQFRSAKNGERGEEALGYQADVGEAKGEMVWGRLYHEGGRGKLDWTDRGDTAVKPGDWNHYEILAIGPYLWTALNSQLVVSCYDPDGEKSGFIALQMHYGPAMTVQYKINKLIHNPNISLAGLNENQLLMQLVPPGRSAGK